MPSSCWYWSSRLWANLDPPRPTWSAQGKPWGESRKSTAPQFERSARRITSGHQQPLRPGQKLLIPKDSTSAKTKKSKRPGASPSGNTHRVRRGHTLGGIARKYGVGLKALRRANRLKPDSGLKAGQRLVIPKPKHPTHTVASGQSLSGIAKRYGVSVAALRKANRLGPSSVIRVGQKLIILKARHTAPSRRVASGHFHTVRRGDTLGEIARTYRLKTKALCKLNKISCSKTIRIGQRLVIPSLYPPGASWGKYVRAPRRPGYLTLRGPKRTWKGYVVNKSGHLMPAALHAVSRTLAGPRGKINSRLIELMASISDTFGGRPLKVVSGLRQRSYARASRHRTGDAIDLRIPGVPNNVLRDYLKTLKKVGVGYYPNSTFVHFDVRSYDAYWIDDSGPGEAPRYRNLSAKNSAPKKVAPRKTSPSSKHHPPGAAKGTAAFGDSAPFLTNIQEQGTPQAPSEGARTRTDITAQAPSRVSENGTPAPRRGRPSQPDSKPSKTKATKTRATPPRTDNSTASGSTDSVKAPEDSVKAPAKSKKSRQGSATEEVPTASARAPGPPGDSASP